jgi:hypothetical protein
MAKVFGLPMQIFACHGYGGRDALGHRHRHLEPKAPRSPQRP